MLIYSTWETVLTMAWYEGMKWIISVSFIFCAQFLSRTNWGGIIFPFSKALYSSLYINKKKKIGVHFTVNLALATTAFRLSLGLVSFLWIDNYSKVCGVFKSQCGYLKPRYVTFHKRVQDVGFLGRWWQIEQLMNEFDVNHKELPEKKESDVEQKLKLLWKSTKEKISQIRNIL